MYLEQMPNLNQLPADLLEKVPKLEPGQIAIFRSLKTSVHYDLEKDRSSIVYNRLFITYKDNIRWKGKDYQIGIPLKIEKNEIKSYLSEVHGSGTLFNGKIVFHGDNSLERKKYEFFMLTNMRKNGLVQDSSIKYKIEFIDVPQESKNARKRRNVLKQALDVAESLDNKTVKSFVAAMNMDETQDIVILRNAVEDYAEKNPQAFLDSYKDKAFLSRAVVRRALDANIIFFDHLTGKVKWNDARASVLASIDPEGRKDWIKSFAEYCGSNEMGRKYMKEITRRLNEMIVSGTDTDNESDDDDVVTTDPITPPVVNVDTLGEM